METCIYSGSLIVPINYPCIDDNVFWTTIHWGNQNINNNTISEEFLMELAVFEVTLIISLLFMFVILFFFKKYV
jgi:hypothetical protein